MYKQRRKVNEKRRKRTKGGGIRETKKKEKDNRKNVFKLPP